MESVVDGVAAAADRVESQTAEPARGAGQIVVVRPEVVESIGHVLGNVFQRLYHLIDRARATDAATATELEGTSRQLEDFLQLVMDYVAPLSLSLQYVGGAEIAQSLARQVTDAVGARVRIDAKLSVDGRLLVDPGRLARTFELLARQLRQEGGSDEPIDLQAFGRPSGRSLTVAANIPRRFLVKRSSLSEMQWAVAEKLLEVQGGALQEKSISAGEVRWEITIPLQP